MRVRTHPRQRAWQPKLRTGCKTCKIRRVKCDEAKPSCNRCTSTGRKCDGYDPEFSASKRSKAIPKTTNTVSVKDRIIIISSKPNPSNGSPLVPKATTRESHSFQFFCSVTTPSFLGDVDRDFWLNMIPRASQTSPAIWHAVVSLGAVHEQFLAGESPHLPEDPCSNRMQFAIAQLQQSIRCLVGSGEETTPDHATVDKTAALTVCILFITICNLQGLQKQVFIHLHGGLRLLEEINRDGPSKANSIIPIEKLKAIFVSLDTQARGILDGETIRTWKYQPADAFVDAPYPILTPADLFTSSQMLYNNIVHTFQSTKSSAQPRYSTDLSHKAHKDYHARLSTLKSIHSSFPHTGDIHSEKLVALAEVDIMLSYMLLSILSDSTDLIWDYFMPQFQRLIELCETILDLDQAHSSPGRPFFFPVANTIQTLWLTIARCRDPTLRRRAIRLLQKTPRREGIWDSKLVTSGALQLIEIEEANSGWSGHWEQRKAEEIPLEARVRDIAIQYETDRRIKLVFRTYGLWKAGKLGIVRELEW